MKNLMMMLVLAVFLTGCGGKKESGSETASVAGKKDYVAEGMMYLKEKDIERAIRSFDLAIKQDPKNPNNFLFLGQVYLRLKQNDKAADTFDAATKVDPNNGQAFFYLAVSRALQQRKADAIAAAQRSADIFLQTRNEAMFKQSVALVKGLSEKSGQSAEQALGDVASDDLKNSISADIPAPVSSKAE